VERKWLLMEWKAKMSGWGRGEDGEKEKGTSYESFPLLRARARRS